MNFDPLAIFIADWFEWQLCKLSRIHNMLLIPMERNTLLEITITIQEPYRHKIEIAVAYFL